MRHPAHTTLRMSRSQLSSTLPLQPTCPRRRRATLPILTTNSDSHRLSYRLADRALPLTAHRGRPRIAQAQGMASRPHLLCSLLLPVYLSIKTTFHHGLSPSSRPSPTQSRSLHPNLKLFGLTRPRRSWGQMLLPHAREQALFARGNDRRQVVSVICRRKSLYRNRSRRRRWRSRHRHPQTSAFLGTK